MTHPSPALQQGLKLKAGPPQQLFFAIFTISGFSGLIYESIWSHYLKLFLGHAAYAQSLVLIIFMGGMALGSWLAARFSSRWRTPVLVYALVEAVVGLFALGFHGVFGSVTDTFYLSVLPAIDSPALGSLLKWAAASLLIIPQSILLGMTFPLMSAGLLRRYPDRPGGSLAMLYFTNSIGAAVGVLASGFWLIGLLGLPGTVFTAGLLNIALAVVVWVLVRLDPVAPRPAPAERTAAAGKSHHKLAGVFLAAAAITGAASFIYEMAWIRMLSLVLGSTTHSFELMLSAFITGLAFGGLWIKRRIDRIDDPIRFAGWIQVLMGLTALSTIPLYMRTFDWMASVLGAVQLNDGGYDLFMLFSHGVALFVMVPTTFLAGMTLPLFTHVLLRGQGGERAIGQTYAANTVGAIAGVLFAMHIGFPVLGLKPLIGFGAALDVLLGLWLLQHAAGAAGKRLAVALAASVAAFAAALIGVDFAPSKLSSGVYRTRTASLGEGQQVVFYQDGKTASISLFASGSLLTIATNGKPDASIQMDPAREAAVDEITMVMAAAIPLAHKPDARTVANIGLGSGLTTHALLADPLIERVDSIEIESAMVRAARGFGERVARTFADPRSRIHIEDAKTFFSLRNERYDVIVAEPSNPWVSGVASLFSEEFYRTLPRYLTADGIFVQWLQLYEFNDSLALSVLKALSQHFSDYAIYNTDNLNVLIVATPTGQLRRPEFERVLAGTLGEELGRVGIHTREDFLVRKTGARHVLASVLKASGVPANSDYYPYLDLHAGRARFQAQAATLFYGWSVASLPVLEMLGVAELAHERVTPSPTFHRTSVVADARHLLSELTDADRTGATNPVAVRFELLGRACEADALDDEWLATLAGLATALPGLGKADAHTLVASAVPAGCAARSRAELRAWTELYQAVAARDAQAMAVSAATVLENHPPYDADQRQYALGALMLGALADGRPDVAIAAWQTHYDGSRDGGMTPQMELLLQIAADRHGGVVLSRR